MKTKIRKVGNSLGLTIPTEIINSCLFNVGDQVELKCEEGKLIVAKVKSEAPNIPEITVEKMSYDELKIELTSGFDLTNAIINSGHLELLETATARSNEVFEEFSSRIEKDINDDIEKDLTR